MSSPLEVLEEDVLLVMSEENITWDEALYMLQEELREAQRRMDEKVDRLIEMAGVMECPNSSFTSATERSSHNIGVHALMAAESLEGRSNHDIRAASMMPTRCSMECSIIDMELDHSVAVVVTCATTARTFMELEVGKCTIDIDVPDRPMEMCTKCSVSDLDVNCDADRAVIAP
uniref:Uncharacterized protein n=1 Tax=Oryza meridionalis TaxID=40149 RepID=A0A0E0DMA5_9ORYZ